VTWKLSDFCYCVSVDDIVLTIVMIPIVDYTFRYSIYFYLSPLFSLQMHYCYFLMISFDDCWLFSNGMHYNLDDAFINVLGVTTDDGDSDDSCWWLFSGIYGSILMTWWWPCHLFDSMWLRKWSCLSSNVAGSLCEKPLSSSIICNWLSIHDCAVSVMWNTAVQPIQ